MSCPSVILSLSKDGRATKHYLMPILRQAQDDTVASRLVRDTVASRLVRGVVACA